MPRSPLLLLLVSGLVVPVRAQNCFLEHADIQALDVEAIVAGHTLWRSPGNLPHAKDVVDQFAGVREYVSAQYGVDPDFFVAMLDEEDWNLVRASRPGCLDDFGRTAVFHDMVVMATPVDADIHYATCLDFLESLGPEAYAQLLDDLGLEAHAACYLASTSSWIPTYGLLLAHHYLQDQLGADVAWPGYLNAMILATDVLRHANPDLAASRSAVARAFAELDEATHGPPDVRVLEAMLETWTQGDFDRLEGFLYGFEALAGEVVDRFGPAFLFDLRELVVAGGVPADTDGWLALYEQLWPGLFSVLTATGATTGPPEGARIESAYPNPFSSSVRATYVLPDAGRVTLDLVDLTGRRVRTIDRGPIPAGRHESSLETDGLPSGVYVLRLAAGAWSRHQVVVLVR